MGFLIGVAATYGALTFKDTSTLDPVVLIRETMPQYRLVTPLLACNAQSFESDKEGMALKNALTKVIYEEKSLGHAKNISIYFQKLLDGRWIGIDDDRQYNPASLLKTVLMISYVFKSEKEPELFSQTYTYTQEIADQERALADYAPTTLRVGVDYGVGNLIDLMIKSSDNGAKALLLAHVDTQILNKTNADLGLPPLGKGDAPILVSPKQYSLVFRILYNATYLSREYSNIALEVLARTTFKNGLRSGVPEDTTVAHKYGEYIEAVQDGTVANAELHDCGIVYQENSPYLLCIMTSGTSVNTLSEVIARLARVTYNILDSQGQVAE